MKRTLLKIGANMLLVLSLFMIFVPSTHAASSVTQTTLLTHLHYVHISPHASSPVRVHIYSVQANLYVAEENNQTNHPLHARTPSALLDTWEEFYIVSANDGNSADYGIQSAQNNLYVSEENSQTNHPLNARSVSIGLWETFRFVSGGVSGGDGCTSGILYIQSAYNGLYVAEEDNQANHPLDARTAPGAAGPWEDFLVNCY